MGIQLTSLIKEFYFVSFSEAYGSSPVDAPSAACREANAISADEHLLIMNSNQAEEVGISTRIVCLTLEGYVVLAIIGSLEDMVNLEEEGAWIFTYLTCKDMS